MDKVVTLHEAVSRIGDGAVIMIGGFGTRGYPKTLLRELLDHPDPRDLSFCVNAPDGARRPELEELMETRCRHVTCTFMRKSGAGMRLFEEGRLTMVPQGTFAESLRLGGMGIPAWYSPVGIGTQVAEGKEIREFDGKSYILERTLKGDVALLHANKADRSGNCFVKGAAKNFTVLMAGACKETLVEAEEIVEVGEIDPELVSIPGILVSAVVAVGER